MTIDAMTNDQSTTACLLDGRLSAIRDDVMKRGGSFIPDRHPFEHDLAAWRAMKQEGSSVVQARAAFLLEEVKAATIRIYPHWRLAGEHLIPGQWGHSFGLTKDNPPLERLAELGVDPKLAPEIKEAASRFVQRGNSPLQAVGRADAKNLLGIGNWGQGGVAWAWGWIENHSIRDYAKVLRVGFAAMAQDIESRLAAADIAEPDFVRKENFWQAALSVCQAGVELGRRYAELARGMGVSPMCSTGVPPVSGQRKQQQQRNGKDRAETALEHTGKMPVPQPSDIARLTRMVEACEQVPAKPARTLFEAVQSLWLAHILTGGEDGINANSIGRLDQILWPYYQADLAAGRVTHDEAVELMEELACKLYLDYEVQAITLAGLNADGSQAANEMTDIILEATGNVGFVRDLSVRLSTRSDPKLVRRCAELVIQGGGIPFFFNDDCFVKAMSDRGIALEDARGYSPIGCIELTIPGRANPHAVSGWFSAAKCLELALFNGKDPRTGEQLGPCTGDFESFTDCDQLEQALQRQMDHFARKMVYGINRGELSQRERGPLPYWSLLTDDCIARGRDITDGGAVYYYHSVCFLGTANVADSLTAIRRLVFEGRRIAPADLLQALRSNFEGFEPIRQMLLSAPKYGNGVAEVDEVAARQGNWFIDTMDTFRSTLGGRFFVHLFSFRCNVEFGKAVGATPDGRRAGEPLAYSLSAQQGRDQKGVSAMIQSLSRLPHNRAGGATAAIIDLDPKLVAPPDGAARLTQIIQAALNMGVGQLQFNVTTVERLRQAQQDPEKYGNIPVRVAGYSQMFKLLEPDLQEMVIARTKHQT
jgi:formate C-acetyltransferase